MINLNSRVFELRPWKALLIDAEQKSDGWQYHAERLRDQDYHDQFEADYYVFDTDTADGIPDLRDPAVVIDLFDGYVAAARDGELPTSDAVDLIYRLSVDAKMASAGDTSDFFDRIKETIIGKSADPCAFISAPNERAERLPHEDEPLSLVEAVCLPILGGKLFEDGSGIPSTKIRVKTLRAEIASGRLQRVPPFNKNVHVSLRTIKEWTVCRADASLPISSGSSPSTRHKVSSDRTDIGQSPMARTELARDSALNLVQMLRKPGLNTK